MTEVAGEANWDATGTKEEDVSSWEICGMAVTLRP